MARLILFSGGAESVAMTHLMAAPDDVLLYVKPPHAAALFGHPAREAAAALARPLSEDAAPPEAVGHQLEWLLPVAAKHVSRGQHSEVWYGLYAGELDDAAKRSMYEKAVARFNAEHPQVPVRWPLFHLSKREQIAALPESIRRAINSCSTACRCGHCYKCKELEAAL